MMQHLTKEDTFLTTFITSTDHLLTIICETCETWYLDQWSFLCHACCLCKFLMQNSIFARCAVGSGLSNFNVCQIFESRAFEFKKN